MAPPARSRMTPLLRWEWIVVLSPIAATILAFIALSTAPLGEGAARAVDAILDGMCSSGAPAFWCRSPRPATVLTAIHFVSFVWFVAMSAFVFWRVRFGPYDRPPNYVPGAASVFEMASWALIWGFMLIGGQVYPYRGVTLAEPSLVFSMLALSLGLLSLRMLAIALRFRR